MQALEQLGIALGLASLAGINLYLTVFLVGLVIRFDWLHLSAAYAPLESLGHPWVLAVAGTLFLLEFFADKVPWVDSLWDTVHTVIRPVGGTLLALQAVGQMPPYAEVIIALVAGSASLTTHSAKAGTRLLINHSPEPVTNITASVVEDAGVLGGTALIFLSPVVAFIVFLVLLVALWLIFPRLFRLIRSSLWLAWNKLRMPGRREPGALPSRLSTRVPAAALAHLTADFQASEKDVDWSAEALSGKSTGLRGMVPNLKLHLIALKDRDSLLILAEKTFRDQWLALPMAGARLEVQSGFLSDQITLTQDERRLTLHLPRGHPDRLEALREKLEALTGTRASEAEAETDAEVLTNALPAPANL
ncbi:MAG: DUF4126 domain-containing protein [Verrucomicrobiales bacterium]|nr:DUF4126 domain-containing protein [Verrucomicrobiales bacterium]